MFNGQGESTATVRSGRLSDNPKRSPRLLVRQKRKGAWMLGINFPEWREVLGQAELSVEEGKEGLRWLFRAAKEARQSTPRADAESAVWLPPEGALAGVESGLPEPVAAA